MTLAEVGPTVVVALAAVAGTSLPVWLTGRQRGRDRREDWARQDTVAARVEAVADRAAEAARVLLVANERVAEQAAADAAEVSGKLGQIHELVNSSLTAQMEEAAAALSQQAVLMREVVALNRAAGREPSTEALDAIDAIDARVAELQARLTDRAKSTKIADAQVAGR